MALFVNQNSDNRSKLQERLAAELSEKAKKKALLEAQERPDGVDDSNYIKDTKTTTSLAWVWILIVLFAVAASIAYMILAS
ncbi:TPA: hypothetical protein DDX46_02440 [Candidatus Saccharibacteria bacterium]|nr:hypothetical protein [Candidatus Saccharibacteria bacterium]OGL23536.1 MAG: hypothetical protein A2791_01700 [Candidatus Saccharibacteria bacterium RIFCSPHIGHO2_01_FULL_46_30]OGL33214.1 MAG: hypothetical protein A3E20_01235 [Candidatus Saccharibacteria bacterium RIFCSPHIGHO2_12_FULL_47_16]MBH1972532.1 hypothetical protein [Candidatus Saccharibacteria bacterium]MBH1990734.1 hypothetical protein [Candidatus Saccharibacteria bacterium]